MRPGWGMMCFSSVTCRLLGPLCTVVCSRHEQSFGSSCTWQEPPRITLHLLCIAVNIIGFISLTDTVGPHSWKLILVAVTALPGQVDGVPGGRKCVGRWERDPLRPAVLLSPPWSRAPHQGASSWGLSHTWGSFLSICFIHQRGRIGVKLSSTQLSS